VKQVGHDTADEDRGHDRERLQAGLGRLAGEWQIPCDTAQIAAVVAYADLLLEWTRKINLTAARSRADLLAEHFPDSFALASVLVEGRLIDVGSGGGLPAIPLAILRPGLRVTLVEPVAKKAAFLRTAVREGSLGARVVVENRRAEVMAPGAGSFDAATARAVLAPAGWAKLGAKLVREGGRVFILAAAGTEVAMVGLRPILSRAYLGGRRELVVLEREAGGVDADRSS